jgi:hypothetical protein
LEDAKWTKVKPQKSYAVVVTDHQPSFARHSAQKGGSSGSGQQVCRRLTFSVNYFSTNFASELSDLVHQKDPSDVWGRGPQGAAGNHGNLALECQQFIQSSRCNPRRFMRHFPSDKVSCFRCLGPRHLNFECAFGIHCKKCLSLGHLARFCHGKNREGNSSAQILRHFVLKLKPNPAPQWRIKSWVCQVESHPSATGSSSSSPSLPPPPPSSIAYLSIDPRLHLPEGFSLVDGPRDVHLHRPRAFVGLTTDQTTKNVAIAIFHLWVVKDDFKKMARALHLHLLT